MTQPAHDLSRLTIDRDAPSPGSKRALKLSGGLAAIAVVFVGGVYLANRAGGGVEVQVATVELVGAGMGNAVGITANGYVVARTQASVSSKISGRLEYLGVTEGSVVRRGEVMARLENQDYQAAVAQAEAQVLSRRASLREAIALRDQVQRDLARAQELLEQELDSRRNVEDLSAQVIAAEARVGVQEAQVSAAEAAVGLAKANLENTLIRAPFDGTVLRKDAEVGEVVAPVASGGGFTRGAVVTMADLETLEVEVDVNEAYIGQISNGQAARIVLDAYPQLAFAGAVLQIVPTADRQRATVQVKVSILDSDPRILTEMGARVEFLEEDRDVDVATAAPRVFVTSDAVRDEAGSPVVWVVRDGLAFRAAVDAGPVSGGRREIRAGLGGGETVIVDPPDGLADGTAVRVVSR
jgi:RND family efflux transporter MFP subunit